VPSREWRSDFALTSSPPSTQARQLGGTVIKHRRSGGLRRGDRRLTRQERPAVTLTADFGQPFKPTHPIVRVGGDTLRIEVLGGFLVGHGSSRIGFDGRSQPRGSVGLGPVGGRVAVPEKQAAGYAEA
jgi:hypothetical protein